MQEVLRQYHSDDLPVLARLFYETVHTVCARDYTPCQLDAWACGTVDEAAWDASLSAHDTVIAERDGKIVGFRDRDGDYLDRLYVDAREQGRGIARRIAERLEENARQEGCTVMYVHASVTAKPFFEHRGYEVQYEQQVERRGVLLTNFRMQKIL